MFLEVFIDDSRMLQGHPKEVQCVFQGSFIDILRKIQGCLNKVSSVSQEHGKISVKAVSRMLQGSFVLQFCFCMDHNIAT